MKILRALGAFLIVPVIIFSVLGCGGDPKRDNSWKNHEDGLSDKPVLCLVVEQTEDLHEPQ